MRRSIAFVVALVAAAGRAVGHHQSATSLRHHYLIGRRECARAIRKVVTHMPAPKPKVMEKIVWPSGVVGVRANVDMARFPKRYCRDVAAGCAAANA